MRRAFVCRGLTSARTNVLVLVLAFGAATAARAQDPRDQAATAARAQDPRDQAAFDDVVNALRGRVPGVSLALVRRGELSFVGAWGLADVARERPLTVETPMRFGSVSKLVTSVVLAKLAQDGRLSLDAVPPNVPRYEGRAPTYAELLEHTAGLPDLAYVDFARESHDLPDTLSWQPGFVHAYSSFGHAMAARGAAQTLRTRFETLAETELFGPLGMTRTRYDAVEGEARSYRADARTEVPRWSLGVPEAGGLVSTPRDLAQVVRLLAGRGELDARQILTRDAIARIETPETSAAARVGHVRGGYALGVFEFVVGDHTLLGHWGRIDGFLSTLAYDPSTGDGFVVIVNGDDRAAMDEVRERLAGALDLSTPSPADPSRPRWPSREGWYRPFTHAMPARAWIFETFFSVHVSRRDDRLVVASWWPGDEVRYAPDGVAFRREGLPVASLVFVEDHDGAPVMVDAEAYRAVSALAVHVPPMVILLAALAALVAFVELVHVGIRRLRGRGVAHHVWLGDLASVAWLALLATYALTGLGSPEAAASLGRASVPSLALLALSTLGPFALALALVGWWRNGRSVVRGVALAATTSGWAHLALVGWVPLVTFV